MYQKGVCLKIKRKSPTRWNLTGDVIAKMLCSCSKKERPHWKHRRRNKYAAEQEHYAIVAKK
jgi:hypothetical protein